MRQSKAFTLIELLVVIAIIAILAAILFPVFAQAKAAAKKSAATSNLKQSALATIMYADNYDDTYPMAAYSSGPGGYVPSTGTYTVTSAFDAIFPYTKSKDLFLDPADPTAIAWRDNVLALLGSGVTSPAGIIYAGTAFNFALFQDTAVLKAAGGSAASTSTYGDPVVSASALSTPAETVMFYSASHTKKNTDNKDWANYSTHWNQVVAKYPTALLMSGYKRPTADLSRHNFAGAPRHAGSVVINYADSHVSVKSATTALPGKAVYGTTEYPVYNLPFDLNGIPDLTVEPNIVAGY